MGVSRTKHTSTLISARKEELFQSKYSVVLKQHDVDNIARIDTTGDRTRRRYLDSGRKREPAAVRWYQNERGGKALYRKQIHKRVFANLEAKAVECGIDTSSSSFDKLVLHQCQFFANLGVGDVVPPLPRQNEELPAEVLAALKRCRTNAEEETEWSSGDEARQEVAAQKKVTRSRKRKAATAGGDTAVSDDEEALEAVHESDDEYLLNKSDDEGDRTLKAPDGDTTVTTVGSSTTPVTVASARTDLVRKKAISHKRKRSTQTITSPTEMTETTPLSPTAISKLKEQSSVTQPPHQPMGAPRPMSEYERTQLPDFLVLTKAEMRGTTRPNLELYISLGDVSHDSAGFPYAQPMEKYAKYGTIEADGAVILAQQLALATAKPLRVAIDVPSTVYREDRGQSVISRFAQRHENLRAYHEGTSDVDTADGHKIREVAAAHQTYTRLTFRECDDYITKIRLREKEVDEHYSKSAAALPTLVPSECLKVNMDPFRIYQPSVDVERLPFGEYRNPGQCTDESPMVVLTQKEAARQVEMTRCMGHLLQLSLHVHRANSNDSSARELNAELINAMMNLNAERLVNEERWRQRSALDADTADTVGRQLAKVSLVGAQSLWPPSS